MLLRALLLLIKSKSKEKLSLLTLSLSSMLSNNSHLGLAFIALLKTLSLTGAQPTASGCQVFPADSIFNTPIDTLPVHPSSSTWLNTVGLTRGLKADFGSGMWNNAPIGIPINYVDSSTQPQVLENFDYAYECDHPPYPIPANPKIEGAGISGDQHILMVDTETCILYELFYARHNGANGGWTAAAGAVYDLQSNQMRPDEWTSADAAGLPIMPLLVRYDEIAQGAINHALRFTVSATDQSYLWPGSHQAGSANSARLPMGATIRLKADYDISGFSATNQIILTAMKKYGMILADNGSSMYFSGEPDERFDNGDLNNLRVVTAGDFEVVDVSSLKAADNWYGTNSPPTPNVVLQDSVLLDQDETADYTLTFPASATGIQCITTSSAPLDGEVNLLLNWDAPTTTGNKMANTCYSRSTGHEEHCVVPNIGTTLYVTLHAEWHWGALEDVTITCQYYDNGGTTSTTAAPPVTTTVAATTSK